MLKGYVKPEINEESVGYSLTFSDLGCLKKVFAKFDLTSSGHNWERAIEKYCDVNNIDTSSIEFDSESDLFAAYSKEKKILLTISEIIEKFYIDKRALIKVLKDFDEDLWGKPEDTVKELENEMVDFTKPIKFEFMVDFKEKKNLNKGCEIAFFNGYTCFYSDSHEMVAIREMLPNKANIKQSSDFFKKLATEFDGKLSAYGVVDSYCGSYDELEDWSLFSGL